MELIVIAVVFFLLYSIFGSKTVKCSACGGVVSKKAKFCPHCGHPR